MSLFSISVKVMGLRYAALVLLLGDASFGSDRRRLVVVAQFSANSVHQSRIDRKRVSHWDSCL